MRASLTSRLVRPLLKAQLDRRPRDGNVEAARAALDRLGGRMRVPRGTRLLDQPVAGVPCEWIIPQTSNGTIGLLYLHGGGYLLGSRVSHRGLAAHLATAIGATAVLVEYRLAPEHPFPASVDDTVKVYRALLDEFGPDRLLVAGDSAGGGLALATALALRDAGDPLPAGVAVISPWTDLGGTGESLASRADVELMLNPARITEIASLYHPGKPADDPLISPLHGDYAGLPPLLIQVGDHEILLSDAVRVAERAAEAGVDVALRVWPEMWHVWHMLAPWMPDARRAINEFARWAMRRLAPT